MTHTIYTQQQLRCKSIARLKQIYSEIGCSLKLQDKRRRESWISAIAEYQSTQAQKVDSQAISQAVAPQELTTVEISFYDHEYYCGTQLIATISYDDNLTQPWVVMVDGVEKFRANSWAKCHRFINWHYQDETLNETAPVQIQTPCTSENRVMAHIFNECQKYGLEPLDDGIYKGDVKLGKVGYTNGNWWVIQGSSGQQQYSDSVFDAVRALCPSQTSLCDVEVSSNTNEYWQYRPLEQLSTQELQQLFKQAELVVA